MFHVKRLGHLSDELAVLAEAGLLRHPPAPASTAASYCSNDYLGLARRGADMVPPGAGASRLVSGEHVEHRELEGALSSWLRLPAALLFTSGYAANVGLVPALADGADDLVLSDALEPRVHRGRMPARPRKDEGVRAPRPGGGPRRAHQPGFPPGAASVRGDRELFQHGRGLA